MTLYSNFFVFETVRIVAFSATTVNSAFSTDLGIYLNQESLKTLDRRIVVNVMLGGHLLAYKAGNNGAFKLGAPQGFEITFRDALLKSHNFTVGAFVYPRIQGKEYLNLWVRWGTNGFFGEFNYIGWQEQLENGRAFSRSVGFCVGMPLVRFL